MMMLRALVVAGLCYFRTLESWVNLFKQSRPGFKEVREPLHPKSQKPVSIILIGDSPG
jgi:hypothetical protein